MTDREEKMYKCVKCGKEFPKSEMEILPGVKCPYCGWRIVLKLRAPVIKKIKAF